MIPLVSLIYCLMRLYLLEKIIAKESSLFLPLDLSMLASYMMFFVCFFGPVNYSVNEADTSQSEDFKPFCKYCFAEKKPRRKHCSFCLSCVDDFHHHCFMFDKCVDKKGFILLCVLQGLMLPVMGLIYFYIGKKIIAMFN